MIPETSVDWKAFEYKYSNNPQRAFENLAYCLFCYEFNQKNGIFRYFNQPHIETNPIQVDEQLIGFQAKYYADSVSMSGKEKDLKEAVEGVARSYPGITTLYFYISTYYGDGMKNVLYAMDFSKMKMEPISENKYSQKLIPVIEMNKQIVALQGDFFPDGSRNIFLEVIKESGQIEQVTLNSNAASSFTDVYTEHNIIYIDSDNEYLYTLEKNVHASSAEYYIVKYTFNFSTVEAIDISSIFIDYAITDNIGVFYAFDNYFCITDYSGNSILCEYSVDGIDVLLCENDLEYVPNSSNNTKYEIFYVRNTNNIYRLDTQKGTLDIRNYDTENGQSVIRCVLAYGNMLIIVKNSLLETDLDEKIYFLSYEE